MLIKINEIRIVIKFTDFLDENVGEIELSYKNFSLEEKNQIEVDIENSTILPIPSSVNMKSKDGEDIHCLEIPYLVLVLV